MQPKTLNNNQAAEFLGVSRATFYRWRQEGHFQAVQIGKSTRYYVDDLIKKLEQMSHGNAA